jgi:hypothetical protein
VADTKAVKIRFYLARKRKKRGDPWPDGRPPLNDLVAELGNLTLGANGTAYLDVGTFTELTSNPRATSARTSPAS